MWTISRIDHVVLWVRDLEKSLAFYQALGCPVDQGTLERYRQGRLPFVKVITGPNSGIDLRPDPNWQPVEREKGNMQHVNLAVEGVDDIQVVIAELAKHGLKPDVGPEIQGGRWGFDGCASKFCKGGGQGGPMREYRGNDHPDERSLPGPQPRLSLPAGGGQ